MPLFSLVFAGHGTDIYNCNNDQPFQQFGLTMSVGLPTLLHLEWLQMAGAAN